MKRLLLIGAGVSFLGLAALIVLWTARVAVVTWGLERVLADRGQNVELTVEAVTPSALVLSDIATGEISAERVLVRFSLSGLLTGRLESVTLRGLRARLDLDGPEGGEPPALPPLPPILLQDAAVSLETPDGLVTLHMDGRVLNPQEGVITAELNALLETPYAAFRGPLSLRLRDLQPLDLNLLLESDELTLRGAALGPANLEAALADDRLEMRFELEDRRNEGLLEATLESVARRRGFSLSSSLSLEPESEAWRLFPAQGLSGSGSLEAALDLPEPPAAGSLAGVLASPAGLLSRLQALGAQTRMEASVSGLSLPGSPRPLNARLDLLQGTEGLSLDAALGEPGAATRLMLTGELLPAAGGLDGQVSFEAAGALDDPFLAALLPAGAEGELSATGALTGRLPEEIPSSPAGWMALGTGGDLRLEAADLTWPGLARNGMADLELSLTKEDTVLKVSIAEESHLSFTPAEGVLPVFGPAGDDPLVLTPNDGPYSLSVTPEEASLLIQTTGGLTLGQGDALLTQTGTFTVRPGSPIKVMSQDLELEVQRLALTDAKLERASFQGALGLAGGKLEVSGEADAVLAMEGLAGLSAERMLLAGPFAATYEAGAVTLSSDGPLQFTPESGLAHSAFTLAPAGTITASGVSLTYEGQLTGMTAKVTLPALTLTGPQRIEATAGGTLSLSMTGGAMSAALSLPSTLLPERDLRLEGVAVNANLTSLAPLQFGSIEEMPALDISVSGLRHPALASASINLSGAPEADAPGSLQLSGRLTLSGGAANLPLSGRLRTAPLDLSLRAGGNTLVFEPGGLQPEALSPLLGAVERAAGDATPSVYLALDDGGVRASGSLRLDGFDFQNGGTEVSAVNGTVAFSDLLVPRTDGVQEVTAARVDPAFPIRDVVARFSVAPGPSGNPLLTIESVVGRSDFGPVRITEGRIDPLTQSGNLRISLPRLDLAQLTALLGVEGLSATGTLSGSLPVALENGVVKIDRGSLDDQEQGVIRYQSPTARQALSGGGESVTLMLDALENFQYQDFGVSLDKPSAEELTLSFSLEGKNPDVLEGYPFRFNINLTTNPRSLLEALRHGSDIGKLLLERQGTFPSVDP